VKVPLSLLTVILLGSLVHRKSALAAGFPAPSFAAGRTFDVGMGVLSMVVGDFNGDGKPDLAVGQWVVLGNGDGTFQAAVNYGAGVGPRPVAVGDFNGDGKPDLAVADEAGVSVLLGKGDGTFQAPVSSGLGTFPRSVAVGDFDGDGRLDLAVATTSHSTNKVSVLLGRGDGTFHAAANYGAGTNPCSVAVGDFNGDGKPDLAVANLGLFGGNYTEGSVSVLLGNGDGTFQPAVNYTPGGNPSYVVAGDFNADGKLDLAVAAYSTNNVSLLLGRGDGTFLAAANFRTASNPSFLVVGDFNGDGKPDLATVNYSGVSVLLSKGDGSFQNAVSYGVGQGLDSLAVGDFDSDGKPDLAVAYAEGDAPSQYSKSYGRVAVFLGEGDGTFQAPFNYRAGAQPQSVVVGDFNGDGKPDVVMANESSAQVSVLLGTGDGALGIAVQYGTGTNAVSVAVGDFNGDGKPDLAVANHGEPLSPRPAASVSVLLGNGDGTFQTALNYLAGTQPSSVSVGDFNGDGKPDLVVADVGSWDWNRGTYTNGSVLLFLGRGNGTFQAPVSYGTGTIPVSVVVSDFNGDGRPDLAVADEYFTKVTVLLSKGDGTFFQTTVNSDGGNGPYPVSLAAGDFNGDGEADLAVANLYSADCSVLLGRGDGTFQPAVRFGAGRYPHSVAVSDFNGDGRADLVVANFYSADCSVLLGNGDGTFQHAVSYNVGGYPYYHSVAVGDFNGDGKPDIAAANYYDGTLSVLLNTSASAGLRLGVARSNSNLTLSWPLPYADFALESTTNVGSTNWQRVFESPMTNSGRLQLAAPFDQPGRFFRLRKP